MDGGEGHSRYIARAGTLKDVRAISAVMLAVHASDPYAQEIDWEKATTFVCDIIERGIVIVIEEGSTVVATAAFGGVATWWYSRAAYLADAWTLIHPAHGSLELFFALCDAIERAAAPTGLKPVIQLFGHNRVYAKDRLFRMRFMDMGDTFIGRERKEG